MSSMNVLAELLRFIAANEDLPHTQKRYPGQSRDVLGKLINAAADRLIAEPVPESTGAAGGDKKLRVRKLTEVEKSSQRTARELESEQSESKSQREQRRERERQELEATRAKEAEEAARPVHTRLYSDGAARGNPGPAGAGAVIINPQGHIVAKVGKFLGDNTNNVAEYMGLILGLRRAKAMGIRELEVLADSELMVKQLNGEYSVKADHLKPLHQEAKALLTAFKFAELRHIPREENGAADEMSNRAIDERL